MSSSFVELDSNGVTLKVIDSLNNHNDFSMNNNNSSEVSFNGVTYTVVEDLVDLMTQISNNNMI